MTPNAAIEAKPSTTTGSRPIDRPPLQVKRLDERAQAPAYQTALAAGLDLAACLPHGQSITLFCGKIALIPTGLALAIPAGFEGQVRPRSGLSTKHGVTVPNAPGTIDADYRGEIKVALMNLGPEPFTIEHGMRVAQLVIAPVAHAVVEVVSELAATERGAGGFGSTGI